MRAAILAALLPFAAQAGQIYKCEVGGRTVFQDQACEGAAADQNVYDVRQLPGEGDSASQPETDASTQERDKEAQRNDLQAQIAKLEQEKERLRQELGGQLTELRAKRTSATDAGDAKTEQRIDAGMQELTSSYQARLRSDDSKVQVLKAQLTGLQ